MTLPSGRVFDAGRSRWHGVLDGEEFAYCRQHEIPLAYDCSQTGWVPETCTDDSTTPPTPPEHRDVAGLVATTDPEQRASELRRLVEADAARILEDVRTGHASVDGAKQRLTSAGAAAVRGFENEHGLSTSDLCHWTLQSAVADALGMVRPVHESPPASDVTAFSFRSWTPHDSAVYLQLLGNPRVWEYLPEPFPSPFTEETASTLIEVAAIGFHHETVAVQVDGRPIGQCLLRFDQPFAGARASEVAYWLGEEHWGKGWMSRILPVFTHQSFRRHDVDVIYAWIRNDNEASIRAAEGAGYQRDLFPFELRLAESLRRPRFIRYATYRADWPAGRAASV